MKTLKELQKENCDKLIPSKWNIYEWAEKNPLKTISASFKRIEKTMDICDQIRIDGGGGKDSTVGIWYFLLELNLRRLRATNGIDRNGNPGIDPLDAKWLNRRMILEQVDAEAIFSHTNDFMMRFLKNAGPEGLDLVESNWVSLPLSWELGTLGKDENLLVSYDKTVKDIWVQPIYTKEQLHGFDAISEDNYKTCNPVLLSSLPAHGQKYHVLNKNVIKIPASELFGYGYTNAPSHAAINKLKPDKIVEAVANYGRGPLPTIPWGMHEKEQEVIYSRWYFATSWLVTEEVIPHNYDTSHDVQKFRSDAGDEEIERDKELCGFKGAVTCCAMQAKRSDEGPERHMLMLRAEYSTGQYPFASHCNIVSPIFDWPVEDVWRFMSACDFDHNEVYNMFHELGIPAAKMRTGSLLNYCTIAAASTIQQIEPKLYERINARFHNSDSIAMMSQRGRKYAMSGKPRDREWDGKNHLKAGVSADDLTKISDAYEEFLKQLNIPYEREDNIFKTTDKTIKNKVWKPLSVWLSGDFEKDKELKEKAEMFNTIHTSWEEYGLLLLNSTREPVRSIWREKAVTCDVHWRFKFGSISEENVIGLEVLSILPTELTKKVADDFYVAGHWSKMGRLVKSKAMNVRIGKIPQESLSGEAGACLRFIIENWNKACPRFESKFDDEGNVIDYSQAKTYGDLFKVVPYLKRMWDFAQKHKGDCIHGEDVHTYILEKPVSDKYGSWIDVADDLLTNGPPSNQYASYYIYPRLDKKLGTVSTVKDGEKVLVESPDLIHTENNGDDLESQKINMSKVVKVMLREDLRDSPGWKKLCICMLRNEISWRYAGFAPTLRELQAREEAVAAFAVKQEERKQAKEEADKLVKKIEAEKESAV